ncbi:MAG: BREX-3 system phosphatase PglZ, partial [Planctomycetes bacterium]|nr:BREX-3 system phosphatase PglZ [Planctomycetota bacterium]
EPPHRLKFKGPLHIPFDHDDVRVYIDNLFLDGLLQPVPHEKPEVLAGKWVTVGLRIDPKADRLRRLRRLVESARGTLPSSEARHQEWLAFACRWAELTALWIGSAAELPEDMAHGFLELRRSVDSAFLAWVQSRYAGLHNQPPLPPVMVHHVPRALARDLAEDGRARVALVIVDGLALDQWVVLRDVLQTQRSLRFRDGAVFAWLPTITSVSRQAAFAGRPPIYFPATIHATDKEAALWSQFWVDQGLNQREIGCLKGLGDGELNMVSEMTADPAIRAMGVVVDKVDRIMHGMELGSAGMHNQVRQWAAQGYMASLLDVLLNRGFKITITSDHGNIEARGCGRPAEGAVADVRGERVRVYPDGTLRSQVKQRFPEAIEWPAIGLPGDFLPLLAPSRLAFVREGDQVVAHGGISVEEMVVPLVQVERRDT